MLQFNMEDLKVKGIEFHDYHLNFKAIFSNPKIIFQSSKMKPISLWIWILNPTC